LPEQEKIFSRKVVVMKALVLDDDRAVCEFIASILEESGVAYETFLDPLKALASMNGDDYDFAFVDIGLPNMDGLEFSKRFKEKYPEAKIISHPESSFEVCQKSHFVGSTEYIINTIAASAPGTRWLVGTELNLVKRLQERYRDEAKSVHFMSPTICMCSTMFRIDPQHLCWVLENLVAGKVVNQIRVPPREADEARVALDRMLALR